MIPIIIVIILILILLIYKNHVQDPDLEKYIVPKTNNNQSDTLRDTTEQSEDKVREFCVSEHEVGARTYSNRVSTSKLQTEIDGYH